MSDVQPHKIFEKYARGDNGDKGTGLGLSISKRVISAHQGELSLVKNNYGRLGILVLIVHLCLKSM